MSDYSGFLKDIEFFRHMDPKEIQTIARVCRPEAHEKDRVVIAEEELKEKFYIIFHGAVRIFKRYGREDQRLLAELTRGQMFGELSLIDHLPRSATVVTSTPSEFLTIGRSDFERLLSQSAAVALAIMKWMSGMIRHINDNFVDTVYRRNLELERVNRQLEKEIEIRKEKERQLNVYQTQLEEKVLSRTRELQVSNQKLKREVAFRRKTEAEKEKALFKLESAAARIKTLSGLFPICIKCRRIRDDSGYWQQLDKYIQEHSEAEFRDSICEECAAKHFPKFYR